MWSKGRLWSRPKELSWNLFSVTRCGSLLQMARTGLAEPSQPDGCSLGRSLRTEGPPKQKHALCFVASRTPT